jgi:hypothetical protein
LGQGHDQDKAGEIGEGEEDVREEFEEKGTDWIHARHYLIPKLYSCIPLYELLFVSPLHRDYVCRNAQNIQKLWTREKLPLISKTWSLLALAIKLVSF